MCRSEDSYGSMWALGGQRELEIIEKNFARQIAELKREKFPQAENVHSSLTEKIHRLRIAASEGPIRSMVQGHDESTR
jgi:hypothetical protein